MKNKGYTVLEMVTAAGLLSCLFIPLFLLFRSASSNFTAGNWKLKSRSEANSFFQRMKFLTELAGCAYVFDSQGLSVVKSPIHLIQTAKNCELIVGVLGDELSVAFMNVTSRGNFRSAQNIPSNGGVWMCSRIAATKRKLSLNCYNRCEKLPIDVQSWRLPLGENFVPAIDEELKMPFTLNDVHSLKFSVEGVSNNKWLITEIVCTQNENGGIRNVFEERIHLKEDAEVDWFSL
ncbi:MAG: hypothetical protein HQM08_19325 [Candidatus Riflebacteria bacterium]|nr:hypothetical protein [Candidatus Riflebacteria bacterium]